MSIYTGFFDSAFDEASGTYDHEYDSSDFVGYFEQLVGSGVCVRGNENSMQVYYDSGSNRAVVNPGYLFIRGYWLKNDGLYTVSLFGLGAGTYAILAQLNVGTRAITIGQVSKKDPESYPDALVLAYATVNDQGGVSIEDTRSRTDICGLIDSAGNLSNKVDYAINYINTEVEGRLDQIEQQLQAQSAELDGKIEEANDLVSQIEPPAAGTIKFSASQNIEEGWLRCDGSFITEANYPELVAALGKNYPSGDKFQLLNTEGVGRQISNGVVCEGRLWVFSYADRKLYGVDVEGGESIREVTLTSESVNFQNWQNPNSNLIALSIIPNLTDGTKYHLFLSQMNGTTEKEIPDPTKTLVFHSDFSGGESSLVLEQSPQVGGVVPGEYVSELLSSLPYVISRMENGVETFYMASYQGYKLPSQGSGSRDGVVGLKWTGSGTDTGLIKVGASYSHAQKYVMFGFIDGNLKELVVPYTIDYSSTSITYYTGITSYPEGTFDRDEFRSSKFTDPTYDYKTTPVVAGDEAILLQVSPDLSSLVTLSRTSIVGSVSIPISLSFPPSARPFMNGCTYLWGKKMFFIFVGTGIIFSRDLTKGSFGYLDTTSILGTITQYASIRYSQDEMTLYIVGQDTTNSIKAAKIVLNTLYDYASDGAWLPLIASDGVPAYIKAIGEPPPPPPPAPVVFSNIQTKSEVGGGLPALTSIFNVTLNNETLSGGKNKEYPATSTLKMTALQDYTNPQSTELDFRIYFYGENSSQEYPVEEYGRALLGKVLARGEQIKKGDEVQVSINMQDLKDSRYTCFYFITKAAQGS